MAGITTISPGLNMILPGFGTVFSIVMNLIGRFDRDNYDYQNFVVANVAVPLVSDVKAQNWANASNYIQDTYQHRQNFVTVAGYASGAIPAYYAMALGHALTYETTEKLETLLSWIRYTELFREVEPDSGVNGE
jgi:hypothetical protein